MEFPLAVSTISVQATPRALWQERGVRLFLLSECLRMLAGYFSFVALPWLVVETTGSAALMGALIFLTGVPRVALVMVFGALADRCSPRSLLIAAGILRVGLFGAGAALAASGSTDPARLVTLCLGFGLVDAIFLPARGAITPRLVRAEQITAFNALGASMDQLWGLAGPGLAGLLITLADGSGVNGAGAVLLTAGAAALLSLVLLVPVQCAPSPRHSQPAHGRQETASLRDLPAFLRRDRDARSAFLMVYGIGAVSATPFAILMPMLAVSRYADGAGALGLLTSALSAGTLLGALAAGMFPPVTVLRLHAVFAAALLGFIAALLVLFTGAPLPASSFALALSAALIGLVTVSGLSHIQRATPPELLGRMIGLLHLK